MVYFSFLELLIFSAHSACEVIEKYIVLSYMYFVHESCALALFLTYNNCDMRKTHKINTENHEFESTFEGF